MVCRKLYLDIEQVRFAERLQIHWDIQSEAEKALLPSLLLQPLVENAIKYAIAQSINGGTIGISARVFGNDLLLVVAQPDKPSGRGMKLRSPASVVRARELGIDIYQPRRLKRPEVARRLSELELDVAITAAYGKILKYVSVVQFVRSHRVRRHLRLVHER